MKRRYELVISENKSTEHLLSVEEVSFFVELHPDFLRHFVVYGLIDPVIRKPEPLFDPGVIPRIKTIQRLRNDLGVNLSGIGLVLDLLDRISRLEEELCYYRRKQ